MSRPSFHLDFETRSRVDLKKCGAFRYAADPSTEILCAAIAKGDHDPLVWAPKKFGRADSGSRDLIEEMVASDAPIYSHNAQFEAAVAAHRTQWNIDPSRWRCTAAMARKAALPSALFAVAKLLGVNQQKDASGTRLIKTFCIPQEGSLQFIEPKDKPVEFCQLMYYCAQDVRAEAAVHKALSKFELSGMSLQVFLADMQVNARGLPVNVEALRHAQKLIAATIGPMTDEFRSITGCNPSQRDAFLKWLEENGCPLDNLRAVTLDEELDDFDFDDSTPVGRALTIKKRLSYAAIKKLDSMIACAGPHDNRVRGTLLYHGAERTGRFSGRLIQPQNFKKPSAHLEAHTENAYRDIMAGCTGEHIEQTYGPTVEVVASCIRHFIHDVDGGDMIDVDYSAIEARIIAWLADEKWRLDVFRTHGMIYEMSAAQMFGIPLESVDKKLRQKGKVAELACIAENQLVTTDQGLVPIQNVTPAMRVWDGISFVKHCGVVYQGIKEVITYENLTATQDHVVFTERGTARFGHAAKSGAQLLKARTGWDDVRLGDDNQSFAPLRERMEEPDGADKMRGMRAHSVAQLHEPASRKVEGVSKMLTTEAAPTLVGPTSDRHEAAMSESTGQGVRELWGEGDQVRVQQCFRSVPVDRGEIGASPTLGAGSGRQRRELPGRKSQVFDSLGTGKEHPCFQSLSGGRRLGQDEKPPGDEYLTALSAGEENSIMDCGEGETRSDEQAQELAGHSFKTRIARTYDILNCGPRNRFTVSGVIVHNCGYQGSTGALENMGALKMGLTKEELPDIVAAWREASPNIVDLWYSASRAATNAILNPNTKYAIQKGKVTYFSSVTAGMRYLFAVLPSGRKLAYPQAKVEETCSYRSKEDGKFKVLFSPTEKQKLKALAEDKKAWIKTSPTYGGFPTGKQVWGRNILSPGDLTNNLVQGIAADIMCGGLLNAEAHGYETATLIHDEWLGYKKPGQTAEELKNLLTLLPPWAKGLPLAAEGGDVPWYRK